MVIVFNDAVLNAELSAQDYIHIHPYDDQIPRRKKGIKQERDYRFQCEIARKARRPSRHT